MPPQFTNLTKCPYEREDRASSGRRLCKPAASINNSTAGVFACEIDDPTKCAVYWGLQENKERAKRGVKTTAKHESSPASIASQPPAPHVKHAVGGWVWPRVPASWWF